jgi:hypothetical protein
MKRAGFGPQASARAAMSASTLWEEAEQLGTGAAASGGHGDAPKPRDGGSQTPL